MMCTPKFGLINNSDSMSSVLYRAHVVKCGLYSLVIVVIYVFLQFLTEVIDRLELLQI